MKLSDISNQTTRWFDVPDLPGVRVHLRLPKRSELTAVLKSCTKRTPKGEEIDDARLVDATARCFILGVEGLEDDNGAPVEYSVEVGRTLLDDLRVGPFIQDTLFRSSDWLDAKNA